MPRNNNGFTLIELLAALALLSIVILLASSIQLFGHNQSNTQSADIQNQANVRLAMNILTKEIRRADQVSVPSASQLTITSTTATDQYTFENNTLKKNGQTLISNLQMCSFIPSPNNTAIDSIQIIIRSTSSPKTELATTIYIRK